ncbi:MAG TPA: S9 family peptidase [Gemmatimonadaceae bacterium]|nr:S9 family peptidase [Gemmatimonadaceae bacterium]
MNHAKLAAGVRSIAAMFVAVAFVAVAQVARAQEQRHPMRVEDFLSVRAVSDPQLSPDGTSILYSVSTASLSENRRVDMTYRLSLVTGTPVPFPDDSTRASAARWSPDGRLVAYVAGGQLWVALADGTVPRRLTNLTGGADRPVWSPSSDRLAFVSAVYPGCDNDACNAARQRTRMSNPVSAHVTDELLFRRWNAWWDGTRRHLFVASTDGASIRDLTPGAAWELSPTAIGGAEGYAFSPDGRELAYTARKVGSEAAWAPAEDVFSVGVAGGTAVNLTEGNAAADRNPVYSPDGRFVAYAAQRRAGYASDRWRVMLLDRAAGSTRELLPRWDRSAEWYGFAPGMRDLYVSTIDRGRSKLFRAALDSSARSTAPVAAVIGTGNNSGFSFSRDGRQVAWMRDAADRPGEVRLANVDVGRLAGTHAVTHVNDALVATLALNPLEEFWFAGAGGDSVQGWVLKPPRWRDGDSAGTRVPAVLLIHGGPEGAWLDGWHDRWNYQLFAATGAAVVIVNPRGSLGYGQSFVDGVNRQWAGAVYEDLMRGMDAALVRYPRIDPQRLGAAGGSFGGFMTNWINGHSTRFKALVTHAGPFNLEHFYSATDELAFPEWEFGGPFWNPTAMQSQYRRHSPHLSAARFATPTLVLHGEQDFRVPYSEGLGMFTALRRRAVPARLVVFPDEGHWITRPLNQRLWWREVQGWLTKYLAEGAGG